MTHINQRRDTAVNWAAANPVLHLGEVGWERDTRKSKLGDGVTTWNALDYSTEPAPDYSGFAPLASPVFTGNPTAPTPLAADDGDSVATTAFVKEQGYAPLTSPHLTGTPTAPTQLASDSSTALATTAFVKQVLLAAHPVGDIKFSVVNVNPGDYLGGTWVAWGSGRVPVGVDIAQTEFNTVEKTGGAKTHTLTTGEIPAHAHGIQARGGASGFGGSEIARSNGTGGSVSTASTDNSTGGGGAHNNLQPYITCYMFKRTA